jgi:hypothetical protein
MRVAHWLCRQAYHYLLYTGCLRWRRAIWKTSHQLSATDEKFLLTYPNLDNSQGEVMLENDYVVVQRLVVLPGEWSGRRGGKLTGSR